MPIDSSNTSSRRGFIAAAGASIVAAGLSSLTRADDVALDPPNKEGPDLQVPTAQKKTGWALVGLGELCLDQVLPAIMQTQHCRPVALVSGHEEKAKKVASAFGIDAKAIYNYDNFDSIKDNPAIDIVYVILPNSMHAEFTIRAFKAGKHVFCEKPMAKTSVECQQMIDAARAANKTLGIAYRLRHEPYNVKAIELARVGGFGKALAVQATFLQNTKAPNTRLDPVLSGGPIYDVGTYCINATRYMTGENPIEAFAWATQTDEPRFREVPGHIAFTLKFPSGALGYCTCGFDGGLTAGYRAMFEKGYIECLPGFPYQNLKLKSGTQTAETTYELLPKNHFAAEYDDFADCAMNNKPFVTPGEEGLADVKVIEAVNRSIGSGKVEKFKAVARASCQYCPVFTSAES